MPSILLPLSSSLNLSLTTALLHSAQKPSEHRTFLPTFLIIWCLHACALAISSTCDAFFPFSIGQLLFTPKDSRQKLLHHRIFPLPFPFSPVNNIFICARKLSALMFISSNHPVLRLLGCEIATSYILVIAVSSTPAQDLKLRRVLINIFQI